MRRPRRPRGIKVNRWRERALQSDLITSRKSRLLRAGLWHTVRPRRRPSGRRRHTFFGPDGRLWEPYGSGYAAKRDDGTDAVIVVDEKSRRGTGVPAGLRFQDARRVSVCRRRKARKEILHAMQVTGRRGVGRGKRRRRNRYSDVRC